MAALRLARRADSEDGVTLVELLVTMVLFSALLAVLGTLTSVMFKDVRRQQGQSDNVDAGRRAVATLDKQVRYANAVGAPVVLADGSQFVAWSQGNSGDDQQQTCVQWIWRAPTGTLEYRTWQPVIGSGAVSLLTGWTIRANGVGPPATGSVFTLPTPSEALALRHAQLTVAFVIRHGSPAVATSTQVTLTALNTDGAAVPLTTVCPGATP